MLYQQTWYHLQSIVSVHQQSVVSVHQQSMVSVHQHRKRMSNSCMHACMH